VDAGEAHLLPEDTVHEYVTAWQQGCMHMHTSKRDSTHSCLVVAALQAFKGAREEAQESVDTSHQPMLARVDAHIRRACSDEPAHARKPRGPRRRANAAA